ncbi:zinc-ribbon domain-containing protein [Paracoccus pacificus]|uniref:Zinc-ribbon domain-containing protein n=1 Tax=Paracoccus pacificus TaxID=1463598 RepID=A0ABW4R9P3_9RHOB
MRLTCPRCGANYQIADDLIPAEGREVECSACGNVWQQPGRREATSGTLLLPDPAPLLSRPLSESILSVLREEAAREIDARNAERKAAGRDGEVREAAATDDLRRGQGAQVSGPDPDIWLRDTGVRPSGRQRDTAAYDDAAAQIGPTRSLPEKTPAMPAPTPVREAAPAVSPAPVVAPAQAVAVAGAAETSPAAQPPVAMTPGGARGSGYGRGFGLAVGVSLLLIGGYFALPFADASTPAGARAHALRIQIDEGRLWLHDRVAALTGWSR